MSDIEQRALDDDAAKALTVLLDTPWYKRPFQFSLRQSIASSVLRLAAKLSHAEAKHEKYLKVTMPRRIEETKREASSLESRIDYAIRRCTDVYQSQQERSRVGANR
jgi:hypothetical protein